MKVLFTCLVFICCLGLSARAQDLNARVQVISPKIQTSSKRVFGVLENALKDFLNGRQWSNDQFLPAERIDCNFLLNITAWDGNSNYTAELQVQSTRPVYGSGYTSTLLNINDKNFTFTYTEGQALDFNEQSFQSNLSSVFAFYAYVIVGLDYDSFSKFGGTPYYAKAQTVVNAAQTSSFTGWNAYESNQNRYWLAQNLNSKTYAGLREFIYNYHRNGLDVMADNANAGRSEIADILPNLSQVDRQSTGAMLPEVFFTAKSDELVAIFSGADAPDRVKAYNILIDADPGNGNKYAPLQK